MLFSRRTSTMLIVTVICLFFALSFGQNAKSSLIDYYVKLIREETSRAYNRPWSKDAHQHTPKSRDITDYGTFDHIIVGAGSTGAVIANRLSEDGFRNVLVLEAGGYSNNFSDIPSMLCYTVGMEYNWGYLSVPQTTSCLGLQNRQCPLHRGKGIGGSSLLNGLLYIRGNKRDYDNWYRQGNDGWSYRDVLPYFKKSENFSEGDPRYHGKNGLLNVEVPKPNHPQIDAFLEANSYLGRKELDYNGEEQIGFGRSPLNIRHGKRESSGHAFLLPIRERKNLRILTHSYVTKILINNEKKATGVLFTKKGKTYVARSRKDIVISAGVFGSPQLLMLSGIGPRAQLEQMGIEVVENLPTNHTQPRPNLEEDIDDYLKGTGRFLNPFNLQAIAFMTTKYAQIHAYPDFEAILLPSINSNEMTNKFWNIRDDLVDTDNNPQSTFSMIGVLLHPKSRGYLRLKSKNPFDYPIINPNWLSDSTGEDIDRLYEGIKLIMEMIDTPPFRKLNTKLSYTPLPNCKSLRYLSRDYWHCFIRHFSAAIFHPIGTCKMGTHPLRGAVVNPELKVFGVANLRVADTSIFPLPTSGHTNAPAMMVGEKAADLIKFS